MNDLSNELIDRLETKVLETYLIAQEKFKRPFNLPTIEFRDMGRTAGKAWYIQNKLQFSPTLFRENMETFLNRTVPHEVAHLVTNVVYSNASAHGREWKHVMRTLGVKDIGRCHSYDTTRVTNRRSSTKYLYGCSCVGLEHEVTTNKHRRIDIGAKFICLKCKTPINYLKRQLVG